MAQSGVEKWRLGQAVEIYSNGTRQWCRGEVVQLEVLDDGSVDVMVQYWIDAKLNKKSVPSDSNIIKAVPSCPQARGEWAVKSTVEIYSKSHQRWYRCVVTEVDAEDVLSLAWNVEKADGSVVRMAKELPRGSIALRHSFDVESTDPPAEAGDDQTPVEDTKETQQEEIPKPAQSQSAEVESPEPAEEPAVEAEDAEVKDGAPSFSLKSLMGACLDLVKRSNLVIKTVYEKGDLGVVDKAYGEKKLSKKEMLSAEEPTTVADIMAQKLIIGSLQTLFPKLSLNGEEGKLDFTDDDIVQPSTEFDYEIPPEYDELDVKQVIVWVDPIDGTKEFTEGIKEAVTTLVGIAYKGRPIAGVIGRPFSGQIVFGVVGLGVFGLEHKIPFGKRDKKRRVVCTTRSHFKPAMRAYISACEPTGFVRAGGSGGKVLMVIEGEADAYVFPSLGTKKWDTCGPEAILLAMGGKLTRPDGSFYDYSKDVEAMNQEGFVATVFGDEYHASFLADALTIDQLDVVVYGATGFTGGLVMEYLLNRYANSDFKFGMAGRTLRKLEARRDELRRIDEDAANRVKLIVCNAFDEASVEAMVRRTAVVLTTVGPYARYGTNLVKACCKYGVDYADLTGEFTWVRQMIDRYEEEAVRSSARITSFCGCVSLPYDCLALVVSEHLRDKRGLDPKELDVTVTPILKIQGSQPSGGTLESTFNALDDMGKYKIDDEYLLVPREAPRRKQPKPTGPAYEPRFKAYLFPGQYGVVDRKVLLRTNAIAGFPLGEKPKIIFSRWVMKSWFLAWAITIFLALFGLLTKFACGRWCLKKLRPLLPKPGQGPSREQMRKARGDFRLNVKTNRGKKVEVEGSFRMQGDPGYLNTAKMLAEQCIVFALQRRDPKLRKIRGGFLTPGSASGGAVLERLVELPEFELKVEDLS